MSAPAIRRTARLIVLDPQDRLLLFRYRATHLEPPLRPGLDSFWFTPGGGIEPGESVEQAALRELAEETGLTRVTLGPLLARRRAPLPWFRRRSIGEESYFLVRPSTSVIDASRLADTENDEVLEVGWWTLPSLAANPYPVIPPALPRLVARILRGDAPTEPETLA